MISTLYYSFYQLGYSAELSLVKTVHFNEHAPALKNLLSASMLQQAECVIQKTEYNNNKVTITVIKQRHKDIFDLTAFAKITRIYNTIINHHKNIPDVTAIVRGSSSFENFIHNYHQCYKHLRK